MDISQTGSLILETSQVQSLETGACHRVGRITRSWYSRSWKAKVEKGVSRDESNSGNGFPDSQSPQDAVSVLMGHGCSRSTGSKKNATGSFPLGVKVIHNLKKS